jgi:hypothetical protein
MRSWDKALLIAAMAVGVPALAQQQPTIDTTQPWPTSSCPPRCPDAGVPLPPSRIYVLRSKAGDGSRGGPGECPALDWHVTLDPSNTLRGTIAWPSKTASVSGSVMADKTFAMTEPRTSGVSQSHTVVTGKVLGNGSLVANIQGPYIDCNNITVPWSVAPPK